MCNHMYNTRTVFGEPVQVPCGTCLTCRQTSQRFLSHRIQSDVSDFARRGIGSSFVTLTIEDEHNKLSKSELQKYFKRLRKCGLEFSYLAIGDYGGKTQRQHYHFIGIGLDSDYEYLLRKKWPFGHIDVEPAVATNINYVVRYISKQTKKYKEEFSALNLEQPFSLKSRGLGQTLFDSQIDRIKDTGRYYYKGRTYAIPPYWLAKHNVLPKRPDFSGVIETARRLGFSSPQMYLNYLSYVKEMSNFRHNQNVLKPAQGIDKVFDYRIKSRRSNVNIDDIEF